MGIHIKQNMGHAPEYGKTNNTVCESGIITAHTIHDVPKNLNLQKVWGLILSACQIYICEGRCSRKF